MDDLIARELSGELDPSDLVRLRAWREQSTENERRYREFVRLWELDVPGNVKGARAGRPDVAGILAEAERRRTNVVPLRRPTSRPKGRWVRGGGVAVAVAAALVLGLGLPELLDRVAPRDPFAGTEVLAAAGGTATFALSDGSVIRLAPHSRIALLPEAEGRGVRLAGRAFFSVASDSLNPFTIRTDGGEAVVLGTRFELDSVDDDLRLVVLDGRVGLSAAGQAVEVSANQVSRVVDGTAPTLERVPDARELLDWPDGLLVFRATPFDEVARELERTFDVHFDPIDPELARRTVSGWFADESLGEVLTAVCRATASRCELDGSRVVVNARNR